MADLPVLDAMDQRILGALMEKQRTVPASYPLSLNGLRTACNQATSREPVVDYSEAEIEERLRALKDRELVRFVWAGKGSRTLKYHQRLEEALGLDDAGVALVTVLLLRGPQSSGELKTRCERLHAFADKADAEASLAALAEQGVVLHLEKRPGEKERRWIHLLGPVAGGEAPAAPAVDRELVLAEGVARRDERALTSWNDLAEAWATHTADELDAVPFEGWLVDRVAELAGDLPVVDLGCGPGHVTARIAAAGASVVGQDPAARMIEVAQQWHPEVTFERASLAQILRPRTAPAWGAAVAWYSLTHLAPSELPGAFADIARTLADGGWLVVALWAGDGVERADAWLDVQVDFDIVLHDPQQVEAAARAAGLTVVERYVRSDPFFDRLYLVACKEQ